MTDNSEQLIAAYIATGLKLREWTEHGIEYRLAFPDGLQELQRRVIDAPKPIPWYGDDSTAYEAAAIILRQLQEDLDEAGVDVYYSKALGGFQARNEAGLCLSRKGPFIDDGLALVAPSRPEAMLAAKVAIEKEKT